MRGGTSKGLYFLVDDLPTDREVRDAVLLAAMGSPDPRQIDGMGGGHPLTSKVAVVGRSQRPDTDVDYLFLQVWPDRAEVSDRQNCGNILAGVGAFAIEQGLVEPHPVETPVRIWMENSSSRAVAHVRTPDMKVDYEGGARIDGVPGVHAPVTVDFLDGAGASCGALLPTGNARDVIGGIAVTCIDNGMPVVCVRAADLDVRGTESPEELEGNAELRQRVEALRLAAGPLMNLGDVTALTVPKVSLLAAPEHGGTVTTRTFIPHRMHAAIGVLGAVSVATACLVPGSVAAEVADLPAPPSGAVDLEVEHPTGSFTVTLKVATDPQGGMSVERAALLRTARLLMRGELFVPRALWGGP